MHDVYQGDAVLCRTPAIQRKTKRPVRFELTESTRDALAAWIEAGDRDPASFLFPGRGCSGHLSQRQYARNVKRWARSIGCDPRRYGTHSLRRTKATLIYRRTKNIRAIQMLLGHAKLESTVRYIGIDVDDGLAISEQLDL